VSWTGNLTFSGKSLYIKMSTACIANCQPGSGLGGTYSDNSGTCSSVGTCISLNDTATAALKLSCTSSVFLDLSYATLIATAANSESSGNLSVSAAFGQRCSHVHHIHFVMPTSGAAGIVGFTGSGVFDHIFFDDTVPSGNGATPFAFYGNTPDKGYTNWNSPTLLGSGSNCWTVEDFTYTTTQTNTEGLFDAYEGACVRFDFGTITGNELGGWHGTDSGAPDRGGLSGEFYGLTISNPVSSGLMNPRSGITMFWKNTFPTGGQHNSISLQELRFAAQNSAAAGWGEAGGGLNWLVFNATPSSWTSTPVTLNASPWAATTYAALAVVTSSNGGPCNLQTIAGGTSSGSAPACPASFGGTVTDSGGVVWVRVGGSTSTSSLTVHGWCAANADTVAAADATCAALSPGDTASLYLDAGLAGCLYRDMPGCGHNQQLFGNYEWLNSGVGVASPVFTTPSATASLITANLSYFDYTSSFTGASGVGSGTLAARPVTCTAGVAYFATDQGNWNTSANGFGQGVLYKCTATNTWTLWYTPAQYPDPLNASGGTQAPAIGMFADLFPSREIECSFDDGGID